MNIIQCCVKTFLLSFENRSQNVPLPTQKLQYGTIFQPAIHKTWQDCFYTTLHPLMQYLLSGEDEFFKPPNCQAEKTFTTKFDRARLEGERAERETELIHE